MKLIRSRLQSQMWLGLNIPSKYVVVLSNIVILSQYAPDVKNLIPVIFNRTEDIALSEVGHIIYHGPWLELPELPVKTEGPFSTPEPVQFFPLCCHPNEIEAGYRAFGCTVHATCWGFLEGVLGGPIPSSRLPAIPQVLRERMHPVGGRYSGIFGGIVGWEPWFDHTAFMMFDQTNIPELRELYQSCEKESLDNNMSTSSRGPDSGIDDECSRLETFYSSPPAIVKLSIVEHLEGGASSKPLDLANTLPEYRRNRVFRRYQHVLFDAEPYQLEDIDWQLLYYNVVYGT